jgi:hypothetical protein
MKTQEDSLENSRFHNYEDEIDDGDNDDESVKVESVKNLNDEESEEEQDGRKIEETQTVEEDLDTDMTEIKNDNLSNTSSRYNNLDRSYDSRTSRSSSESLPGTPKSRNSESSVITIFFRSIKIFRVCNTRDMYT